MSGSRPCRQCIVAILVKHPRWAPASQFLCFLLIVFMVDSQRTAIAFCTSGFKVGKSPNSRSGQHLLWVQLLLDSNSALSSSKTSTNPLWLKSRWPAFLVRHTASFTSTWFVTLFDLKSTHSYLLGKSHRLAWDAAIAKLMIITWKCAVLPDWPKFPPFLAISIYFSKSNSGVDVLRLLATAPFMFFF